MTKGDKYYETRTYVTGEEKTYGPFEYRDAQYFLDGIQRDMKALYTGTKVRIWTKVYNEWEGPFENTEFSFIVG